jgi:hypothetical protein
MTEKQFVKRLCKRYASIGAFRVENAAMPGTPDICTTIGWIEAKVSDARNPVPQAADLLRPQQKAWIARWLKRNGGVSLMVYYTREKCAAHYLLGMFQGRVVAHYVETMWRD